MSEGKLIRAAVVIPAAGRGQRMGSPGATGAKSKNYLPLLRRPVLVHTLAAFEASFLVSEIVLVVAPPDIEYCSEEIVSGHNIKKVVKIIGGGSERQDSVANGLKVLSEAGKDFDVILVHDGARCLVTIELIEEVIRAAYEDGAAIAAVAVKDTIKQVDECGRVESTLKRESLRAVQTPQAFRADIISKAYEEAATDGFFGTDSSSLVEEMGVEVRVVEGSYENIKITTADDLLLAEKILLSRAPKPRAGTPALE